VPQCKAIFLPENQANINVSS